MKLIIERSEFDEIQDIDLFICAIGFEERSIFQIENLSRRNLLSTKNVLCFSFKDNRTDISERNSCEVNAIGISPIDIEKDNICLLLENIIRRIQLLFCEIGSDAINIHVDYSSMPRSWYSTIFLQLIREARRQDKVYFWYSHGDYTEDIKHCSNAGADDFVIFSGKASIKPRNRSHILGLGYDTVKSDAIRTVVDPSTLIVCYTYPENNIAILKTIQKFHERTLNSAALSVSLPIENFGFIVKRIKELIIDMNERGDVVLIPDGPKPLILACSILPAIINKIGIVCFHVTGHSSNFYSENIKPTGIVSGFFVNNDVDE